MTLPGAFITIALRSSQSDANLLHMAIRFVTVPYNPFIISARL